MFFLAILMSVNFFVFVFIFHFSSKLFICAIALSVSLARYCGLALSDIIWVMSSAKQKNSVLGIGSGMS